MSPRRELPEPKLSSRRLRELVPRFRGCLPAQPRLLLGNQAKGSPRGAKAELISRPEGIAVRVVGCERRRRAYHPCDNPLLEPLRNGPRAVQKPLLQPSDGRVRVKSDRRCQPL